MGTEVYELADALLADLLESDERMGVLARYRSDHDWDQDSIAVVLQLIEDLHASGRLSDDSVVELRGEIASWSPRYDDEATDELPSLAGIALDDPTEELDEDTDVTVVLPPEMQQQLGLGGSDQEPPADAEQEPQVAEIIGSTAAEPEAPQAPRLEVGQLIANRYRLDRQLGEGGYCVVFRARDLRHEKLGGGEVDVALKALRPELLDDERAVVRLKQEYRTVGHLSHPGIVRVLDLDCDTGQWFFTMECLDGESLAAWLRGRAGEPTPLEEALPVLAECAGALDFAHDRGHVHGDLKPANIFLTASGDVKLLDWSGGIDVAQDGDARPPGRAATRAYASPQVLDGSWPGRSDDLFSFACVAYEMLTGRHPFDGRPPVEWRDLDRRPATAPGLPHAAAAALAAALGFTPAERPQSASELVERLTPVPAAPDRPVMPPVEGVASLAPLDHPALVEARDLDSTREPDAKPAPAVRRPVVPLRIIPAAAAIPRVQRPVLFALAALVGVILLVMLFSSSEDETPAVPEMADDSRALEPAPVAPPPEVSTIEPATDAAIGGLAPSTVAETALAATSADSTAETERLASVAADSPSADVALPLPDEAASAASESPPTAAAPPAAVTWVSFESADVMTSEAAVSAVLRVQRLEGSGGRVRVNWRVVPGTATAGEDFEADAAGTASFADGQAIRAIYVPLLPDRTAEGDETFVVELTSNRRDVRIGPIPKATVTIRDDD